MANIPVISFNAGKLTELVDGRSDIQKYNSGCRILDNMIPRIYGPVERRPGTKFIANVEDDDVKSRMVKFVFSATIAYKMEFSDQIINIYFGDDIVDGDIVSPYLEADLFQLQFEQSADVVWITHPSYNPRKLSRVSATEFTLEKIEFETGPFIERNDIAENDDVTIAVTGTSIATATLGAAGSGEFTITTTIDTSSLFPVNQRFYVADSTGNDKAYTVKTASWTTPTLTIVPNEAVATSDNDGQIMVDGQTATLTASSATFVTGTDGHTDALFELTHKRLKTAITGTGTSTGVIGEAIDVKGGWTFNTSGNWDATVEIQRLEDGTIWETFRTFTSTISDGKGSRNVQKTDIERANGVQYRINVTSYTAGTIEAEFTVDSSTQDSIYKITATASTTSLTATVIVAAPDNVATKRWAEGSWSNVRGWPTTITFFQERAIYGFTNLDQQSVYISRTDNFENFDAGLLDDDAFTLRLPTANRGIWLSSLDDLTAGTAGDEWRISTTKLGQTMTPTANWDMKEQSARGSANIQAVKVNEAVIFVDFVARKIREFTFVDQRQKYLSPDLTALAEDITSGGITSLAVQKNPDSIIWFTIANSPYLISMTYEREQDVVAFSNHPLGGDGIAESVIVTPSTSEDVITLTVKRTINGSTVRFIEEMQPRKWGDNANIFFVDAGIIDTSESTTISGLDHLEGETVLVLVDGAKQLSKKVSDGEINIDEAGERVVVGLSSTYQVSPTRRDIVTTGGTTLGSIKKVAEVAASFFETLNAEFGDGTYTRKINGRTTEDYDSPPDLFTGLKILDLDNSFDNEDDIIISGSDPFPCTLRALVLRTDKTGR